eukprot:SM000079S22428  [mRNA]  locus=s79:107297:110244:+ [translate_table: standard]
MADPWRERLGPAELVREAGGGVGAGGVAAAVRGYESYHAYHGGDEAARKSSYTDMVNKYYDLATSFYEYGWGESFHFAHRHRNETLRESIRRHEHFLALRLGLRPGMKVLDVGCGVGGPLREIALFRQILWNERSLTEAASLIFCSGASVTGLNNNAYQISRGEVLEDADLVKTAKVPWYQPLDPTHFSITNFRLTFLGRSITRVMVWTLEKLSIAPAGSYRVAQFLEKGADGLVEGGRKELFTPMYFFLARKPLAAKS